jgi:hypothetical protein
MFKEFGLRGFYHGCVPPLIGSSIYRGVMLSGYELSFSYFHLNFPDDHIIKHEIFGFVRPMVVVSVIFSSLMRGMIEGKYINIYSRRKVIIGCLAPFEYAKLMGQTEQKWEIKTMFRGLHWQLFRTTALLLPIFTTMDYCRRKTKLLNTLAGHFAVVFGIVGTAYTVTWPLETLKNLAQAGLPRPGASAMERVKHMGGPLRLMRGVAPGRVTLRRLIQFDYAYVMIMLMLCRVVCCGIYVCVSCFRCIKWGYEKCIRDGCDGVRTIISHFIWMERVVRATYREYVHVVVLRHVINKY